MAFQALSAPIWYPEPPNLLSGGPTYGNTLIDAADEGAANIIMVPKSGNISKICFRTGTVTTGSTLEVRVETVDFTAIPAKPSGTLWGTNTNGTQAITNTDGNKIFQVTLTSSAAVTVGDAIALVVKQPAASFGNANISNFGDIISDVNYSMHNTGVSPATNWAALGTSVVIYPSYDDGTYPSLNGIVPLFFATATISCNTGTAGFDNAGVRFRLPFTVKVGAAWVWQGGLGEFAIKIVSSDFHEANNTGVLVSKTIDKNLRKSVSNSLCYYSFPEVTLDANTWYRILIVPTTTTNITLNAITFQSEAEMATYPHTDMHDTTAKNPTGDGSWTNYDAVSPGFRRSFLGLGITAIDFPAGAGGGLLIHPGMSGGVNG